jgi:hypothetical protein
MSIIYRDSHPENITKDIIGWSFPIGSKIHLYRTTNDGRSTKYDSVRGAISRGPYFNNGKIYINVAPFNSDRVRSIAIIEPGANGEYQKTLWFPIEY